MALRDFSGEVREEPRHIGVFAGKNKQTNKHMLVEHQKITAKHKKQTSQVNNFSASLCMGRCKSLGLLKLFLWYAPQLSRASILFFCILNPVRVYCDWGWVGGGVGGGSVADGFMAATSFVYWNGSQHSLPTLPKNILPAHDYTVAIRSDNSLEKVPLTEEIYGQTFPQALLQMTKGWLYWRQIFIV